MQLDDYLTLGRTGLRVSPMSLGTMTFGDDWGWGADASESRRIYDAYRERGGNFIDTANFYTGGSSERLLGQFVAGHRDEVVIATKYTMNMQPGNPNAGGNHRRNMLRSVEASLERLGTDYIDVMYLHAWDGLTPAEEIIHAFDDIVRSGKVMYVGISDAPAWQVSRMQTVAALRGLAPIAALQIEYNLIERTVERELLPMAHEMGIGVLGWSPLASGVLTGKYTRADMNGVPATEAVGTRKSVAVGNGALTARGLDIADVVGEIAKESGRSAAQVALAWTMRRVAPSVIPIIGARTLKQFEDNVGALDLVLSDDQARRLDEISVIELGFPHDFMARPLTNGIITGGTKVRRGW
ncbi:aryl-alcohol dehydrogenase-like predicted oxidoreductase [Luteibacter rhizovicinus]|uniref:Aryl-alcohol dehydrogenase-like predicted oxidoreductase n=1 Tax=Luteibacter rhizovicinus TaxID=242606 RepID=A0A4R3YNU4_9GAMM|nr:aldo/keto reductase [Luteibacter rhizovicinus]TCV94020.1 aryl-alcohol dehydrogenase-like predicted oxidoreductase [Luteibacter rhizovicinus]